MSDQTPKTMHPFVAAVVGIILLVGVAFLMFAGYTLVVAIPPTDAATAYQATVWGFVALVLSGVAGARLSGGDNPIERIVRSLSSLTQIARR